ncbi:MAG TPA: hypothetical protein PKI20_12350 [Verrucomicrobiota bacterium]|nr:hypothetical protein [Verrucomicrobiota bacterium]HQL78433.1 hypothetical protein [Verrucomicrobiota bacterium]
MASQSAIPNPNVRLLVHMREVMRQKHFAIRTELAYAVWARRCVHSILAVTIQKHSPVE